MNIRTGILIGIGILLLAIMPLPYGFYTLTRIYICLLTGFLAYKSWKNNLSSWMWIFGIIAIVFNPIIPIFLDRSLWAIIDIITAVILFASISQLKAID
ncbi:DUF6804 family protein [Candidatus Neomarinimicrobiota bacterium]